MTTRGSADGIRPGLLLAGAAEVATLAGGVRRGTAQGDASVLTSAVQDGRDGVAVLAYEGRIVAVGSDGDVERRMEALGIARENCVTIEAAGRLITPGLIDPHTHLLFRGAREQELRLRHSGAGYLDILAAGGGILSTVEQTREASEEELLEHGRRWLGEMLRHGVTSAEVKSGYGLDTSTELRLLAVAERLGRETPLDVVPTFLGAHAVPREYGSTVEGRARYLRDVIEHQLPEVAAQSVARYCDVFCEEGVFTAQESRTLLEAARSLGLEPRLHADELKPSGGAELAAEIHAASADHLAAVTAAGMAALAAAAEGGDPVVATLLPATTLYLLSEHFAPARALIEQGVPVALGTDFNPGTSPTPNLQLVLSLACLRLEMTPAEALVATTINAARALGMEETHGSLEAGKHADLVLWDVERCDLIPYWLGADLVACVVKQGRVVYERELSGS